MPSDDWATRHPELVHWLHHAEDELVGYEPLDALPTPVALFPERLLPEGVSHVLGLSEGLSKLIAIDKQPNHQIVHLFRLRKTNRAAH